MSTSEDWKNQPPYGGFDVEKISQAEWSGGCHCGSVKYEIYKKKPLDAKFCHCTTCQKMHGAPFQWAAIFDKNDIRFLNGAANLRFYNTKERVQDHMLPCKVFCSTCLSPLMDEGRRMCMLLPSTIDFAGKEQDRPLFAPTCHIEYENRSVGLRDGRPQYPGLNGQSEPVCEEEASKAPGTIPLFK
ncbi:Mss4-like protein [Ascosphaera apis ARSEF 7405]|uniref:Mss4-like protein n=1 Tax=Ascosphaera apis ARSEF 7405 TaxID=392613 RepID=A0A167VTK1_9EURO|nr:Mss4-like protein [Ascosphaera apis ARSEF 7405]